jgi:hypothetical protein
MDCVSHSPTGYGFVRHALRRRASRPIIPRSGKSAVISGRFYELPYWVEGQKTSRTYDDAKRCTVDGCFDLPSPQAMVNLRWFGRPRLDTFGEPDTLKGVRPVCAVRHFEIFLLQTGGIREKFLSYQLTRRRKPNGTTACWGSGAWPKAL